MNYNKLLFNILILLITTSMHLIIHTMGLSQVIPKEEIVQEATECGICQDNCEKGSSATFLRCSERANGAHIFHTICINQWLTSSHTCPLCRKSVNTPIQRTNPLVNHVAIEQDLIAQIELVSTNNNLSQERRNLIIEALLLTYMRNELRLRIGEAGRRTDNEENLAEELIENIEVEDQIMLELNQEQIVSKVGQNPAIGLGLAVGMLGGALFNKLGQTKSALIAKGTLIAIPIAAFLYSLYNNTQRTKSTTAGYALGFLASIFAVSISNKLQDKQNEEKALEYTEFLEQDTDVE